MRNQPKGARFASFGLGLCIFALMPNEIGYQDIASLLARQPGVAERWQKRVFSAAASIQLATYSFGRPIGTSTPESVTSQLASLDNQGTETSRGRCRAIRSLQAPPRYQASDFPKVDRTLKGDRLAASARRAGGERSAVPARAAARGSRNVQQLGLGREDRRRAVAPGERCRSIPNLQAALSAPPLAQYDISMSLEAQPLDDAEGRAGRRSAPSR